MKRDAETSEGLPNIKILTIKPYHLLLQLMKRNFKPFELVKKFNKNDRNKKMYQLLARVEYHMSSNLMPL